MSSTSNLRTLGIRRIGEAAGVTEFQLKNGLKILLKENHSAPVVSFMVVYRVGSRNEAVGHTGSTHFLEHMMFKGTRKFNPAKGNGVMEMLARIGALRNATTWLDRTNYFECGGSEHLELYVQLEADRMRGLLLRQEDRDSEMTVVRNEFERGENEPSSALSKELTAIAIREHPYHHPTIGWRTDVEGVPMERMKEFYDTYYWPNNATVIAVGDFDEESVLKLIAKYFGPIPKSPHTIPEVYTVEPPQEGERRFELKRAGDLPLVSVGYHGVGAAHPDSYALSALAAVLGGAHKRSSRLYKRLMEAGLATACSAHNPEFRDPALFEVDATLTPGTTFEAVEAAIYAELELLAKEPVSADELRRIKAANRKGTTLASADPQSFANMLCQAEASATWRWMVEYDDKFDAVTAEDIMRVAGTYFSRDNRTVGHFIPTVKEASAAPQEGAAETSIAEKKSGKKRTAAHKKPAVKPVRMKLAKPAKAPVPFADRVKREVLPNGLTLMFMPNPGTGSVAIQGISFAGPYFGRDKLTVAGCVSQMMTKGSKAHSKFELAEILEEMGARFAFSPDRFRINYGTLVVADDYAKFVPVMADVLMNPLFLDAELTATKRELAAGIKRAQNSTGERARQALMQSIFSPEHPFYDVSYPERLAALEKITVDDLRSFHKEHYSPQSTIIVVVGDIAEEKAMAALRAAFGSWQGPARKQIAVPVVEAVTQSGKRYEVMLADKASVDIVLGSPTPVGRQAPDFFAAYLANAALGQDTISARLGKVLRVREGLTYGIYSYFDDTSYGGAPWQVSISVNPQNVERSITLINEVLADYLKKGITQEELEDEAGRAVGSFTVQLRTSSGIAQSLARFESMGLGVSALDTLASDFTSVTRAQANEALRKYFRPENLVTAMAGTLLTARPASELATSSKT